MDGGKPTIPTAANGPGSRRAKGLRRVSLAGIAPVTEAEGMQAKSILEEAEYLRKSEAGFRSVVITTDFLFVNEGAPP